VDTNINNLGEWSTNLRETDKGLELAFQQCVESKDECPLYEPTVEAVKQRYFRLLSKIEENPIQINIDGDYAVIRRSHIHQAMFFILYNPYTTMKLFFSALRGLEDGDNMLLWQLFKWTLPRANCRCGSKATLPIGGPESGTSVRCTDAEFSTSDHKTLRRHFEELANISQFGDIFSALRMDCAYVLSLLFTV
jgi:hypothetical protein